MKIPIPYSHSLLYYGTARTYCRWLRWSIMVKEVPDCSDTGRLEFKRV